MEPERKATFYSHKLLIQPQMTSQETVYIASEEPPKTVKPETVSLNLPECLRKDIPSQKFPKSVQLHS